MPSKPIGPPIPAAKGAAAASGAQKPVKAAPAAAPPPDTRDAAAAHEEEPEAGLSSSLESSSKRRMPDNLRKFLLRVQGGKFYLPAAYRIVWFRDECPDWGVSTQLIEGGHEAGFATVQATVVNPEGRVIASGLKTESRQDFPAGWVEKAETGSIARALALAGFGTQFSPELDDEGFADSPQPIGEMGQTHSPTVDGDRRAAILPASAVWEGPGQCPRCHAPQGKRHGKPCVAG